jgi:S1-C subfamily serine protease
MVPSNAIQRTFRLRYGDGCGTAFTIDHNSKQYLVTARHVVSEIKSTDHIEIFHQNDWHSLTCQLVGRAAGDVDIAVLSVPLQLSPPFPLPPTTQGIVFGQEVFFLGFPYNLFADVGATNRDFPLPFIKRATLSSISSVSDTEILFLDSQVVR